MSNQNDATTDVATDVTTDAAATGSAKADGGKWVTRFGPMTKLSIRTAKNDKPYALFELSCKNFKQTGFAFGVKAIDALKALGVGKNVWIKGVMQENVKTNANGGTYTETTFHAVYVKENMAGGAKRAAKAAAPKAAAEDVAETVAEAQAEPQVETVAVDDLAGVF